MLERNNTYFEELRRAGDEFEERRSAHEEKKQEIIDTYGWDSEELKAWYDTKSKMEYPVPAGACKAYRAWMQTLEREEDEVELNDFLWDREVEDFIKALKSAGIKTFIYTNQSTAVMENIHAFEQAGCRMDGLCKISRTERRFGENRLEQIIGIHFTVC